MHGPTSDHTEILRWAERHQAAPAEIKPFIFDSLPSVLYFIMGRGGGTTELHPIAWEDFFARFDLMGLVMVFDETPNFEILQLEKQNPVEAAGGIA